MTNPKHDDYTQCMNSCCLKNYSDPPDLQWISFYASCLTFPCWFIPLRIQHLINTKKYKEHSNSQPTHAYPPAQSSNVNSF